MKLNVDIEFQDGRTFRIPAITLAELRADYYAVEVDGHTKGSAEYAEEVGHAMKDHFDLLDYAQNNLNWVDLKPLGEWVEAKGQRNIQKELNEVTWKVTK